VHAYGIRPSTSAETLISLEKTIRTKLRAAHESVGAARPILPEENGAHDEHTGVSDPITALERIRSILAGWCPAASRDLGDSGQFASNRLCVAATASKGNGFLALCTDESGLTLLASEGNRVSDSPRDIMEILLRLGSEDVSPNPSAIAQAQEHLRSWFLLTATIDSAGMGPANVARVRRRALRRISAAVERSRPHARQRLLSLAERARVAVLGTLGAAAETELLNLASSQLPDEKWLQAVVQETAPENQNDTAAIRVRQPRMVALLLLDDANDSAMR
jgi:hypothetical protein